MAYNGIKRFAMVLLALFMAFFVCACGHEHTWVEATCISPKICSVCGATDGEALGHSWIEATCTTPKTCSACGATEGEALGHTWAEATCTEPKTCSVCGATEGEALGHTWAEATCTEPKTCSVCGVTEGEALGHTWAEATCIEPKTCSVCGVTEGEALGHAWAEATCTEPKICSVCGAIEGEALGHTWAEATCTEPKTCSVCGATEGKALGHTTTTGTCKRCGQNFGKWMSHYYVDNFQQPTNEWFITNIEYVVGSFSNSATTNSKLNVQLLIDKDDVAFMLFEYGRSQVKNSSSRYYNEYDITMKDSAGKTTSLTGKIYAGGDRLIIDDKYKTTVLSALKGRGSVSFYIVRADRTTTTYLFTVECSNFAEIYASKGGK